MAGGTFTAQNKIRPGAYINFKSKLNAIGKMADRGICAVPLSLDFGPSRTVISVNAETDFFNIFGADILSNKLMPVRHVLKRAKKCLVYRLNSGVKAIKTVGNLTITSNYEGTLGNHISIQISTIVDMENKYSVNTYLDSILVANEVASKVEDLIGNDFVTFSGTGLLSASSGINLSEGLDGEVTAEDYSKFFESISLYDFNTLAIPSSDITVISAAISFIKRMRENEGKKSQIVLATDIKPDYEGVINVKNGVVLSDGKQLSKNEATYFVAGATAGAKVNESLTYSVFDDAVDANPRYLNSEIEDILKGGGFVFSEKGGKVVCEQDINSFTSVSCEKAYHFSKNRVIRVLDSIGNDIRDIFTNGYIGKISNDKTGRALFKAECIKYIENLENVGAVMDFVATQDVVVCEGENSDSIKVDLAVRPVDSLEKLYMTITVS